MKRILIMSFSTLAILASACTPAPVGYDDTPTDETPVVEEVESTELSAWKPVKGEFVLNLPSDWSAVSFDAGHASLIQVYVSGLSWKEAHDLADSTGDLSISIGVTEDSPSEELTLTWTTEGNIVKSNRLVLKGEGISTSLQLSYPSDSTYSQEIQTIIDSLNLEPSQAELDEAQGIS